MRIVRRIGIICENESDFKTIETLIKRISGINTITCIRKSKDGASHIHSKGADWAESLRQQGCQMLLVVRDSDTLDVHKLKDELNQIFSMSNFYTKFISVPVQEIEAWILSDHDNVSKFFNLKDKLNFPSDTSLIDSPKEALRNQIRVKSGKKRTIYIKSQHNHKLADIIDLSVAKKRSKSFCDFFDYISNARYQ